MKAEDVHVSRVSFAYFARMRSIHTGRFAVTNHANTTKDRSTQTIVLTPEWTGVQIIQRRIIPGEGIRVEVAKTMLWHQLRFVKLFQPIQCKVCRPQRTCGLCALVNAPDPNKMEVSQVSKAG